MPDKELRALPQKERPHCPYEKQEYDAVTSSLTNQQQTEEKPKTYAATDDPQDAEGAEVSFGSTFSFPKEKVD